MATATGCYNWEIMQKHRHFIVLWALLLAGSTLPGQDPLLELPRATGPDLVFRLGGEADSDQGRLAEAKVHWQPTLESAISVGYTYSSLATADTNHPDTRIISLGGEHAFGGLGVGGDYDHVEEQGLLSSNTFRLRPFFERGPWRLELSGSTRRTDFDRIDFANTPIPRPSGTLYVSGSAQLHLTSTGIGGVDLYMNETWHFYGAYDHFEYQDFEGQTTVGAIRDGSGRVGTPIFNALSGRLVTRLQRLAGSRATVKASLLDESATLGMDATLKRVRLGLEASRDKEHLTGNVSESLTGLLSLNATQRTSLEFRAGATQSESLGTIRFIGLMLVFRSLPRI